MFQVFQGGSQVAGSDQIGKVGSAVSKEKRGLYPSYLKNMEQWNNIHILTTTTTTNSLKINYLQDPPPPQLVPYVKFQNWNNMEQHGTDFIHHAATFPPHFARYLFCSNPLIYT